VFPIPAYQGEPLDPEIRSAITRRLAKWAGFPDYLQLQPALGGVLFSRRFWPGSLQSTRSLRSRRRPSTPAGSRC
jgi:hypothetical protein